MYKKREKPPPFKKKEYYIGSTNEKTRNSDDSPSENNGCARNLGEEHENEEGEKYSETAPEENDSIKSKISEEITEKYSIISLLSKNFSLKVIKAVILSIDTYKQDMIEVGNQGKKSKQRQM